MPVGPAVGLWLLGVFAPWVQAESLQSLLDAGGVAQADEAGKVLCLRLLSFRILLRLAVAESVLVVFLDKKISKLVRQRD